MDVQEMRELAKKLARSHRKAISEGDLDSFQELVQKLASCLWHLDLANWAHNSFVNHDPSAYKFDDVHSGSVIVRTADDGGNPVPLAIQCFTVDSDSNQLWQQLMDERMSYQNYGHMYGGKKVYLDIFGLRNKGKNIREVWFSFDLVGTHGGFRALRFGTAKGELENAYLDLLNSTNAYTPAALYSELHSFFTHRFEA